MGPYALLWIWSLTPLTKQFSMLASPRSTPDPSPRSAARFSGIYVIPGAFRDGHRAALARRLAELQSEPWLTASPWGERRPGCAPRRQSRRCLGRSALHYGKSRSGSFTHAAPTPRAPPRCASLVQSPNPRAVRQTKAPMYSRLLLAAFFTFATSRPRTHLGTDETTYRGTR
jgi:hypothetical protein